MPAPFGTEKYFYCKKSRETSSCQKRKRHITMELVIATKNSHKVREIKDKFSCIENLEIRSLDDFDNVPDVLEDGKTFEQNSLKKAREISRCTGLPCLADDSGLVVDALKGEPGVYSARYAGENATDGERNSLVLEKMKDIPDDKRAARFICAIAIVMPDGREFLTEGRCEGTIAREPGGDQGFGYDPIFYLPDLGKTMAELPLSEKNRISHRALALEKAKAILAHL